MSTMDVLCLLPTTSHMNHYKCQMNWYEANSFVHEYFKVHGPLELAIIGFLVNELSALCSLLYI